MTGAGSGLFLRPLSSQSQRAWVVSGREVASSPRVLVLTGNLNSNQPLGAVRLFLDEIRRYATPEDSSNLARLDEYIQHIIPNGPAGRNHGDLLAQSVAFAVLRRISRESAITSRLIDLSARTLNRIISRIPECDTVLVSEADALDRMSLKVVARAMLLLTKDDGFAWRVHSRIEPAISNSGSSSPYPLYETCRRAFLKHIIEITGGRTELLGQPSPFTSPSCPTEVSLYRATTALVLQNYDECILCCESLLSGLPSGTPDEAYRLLALASINVGDINAARWALETAEHIATSTARRAHLAYLQGLIAAKRAYNLDESNRHYLRALSLLDDQPDRNGEGDLPLEEAWLFNGLALNEAILAQRHGARRPHHLRAAFSYEQRAFGLVRDGDSPARAYLRFNLLANSAFLLEMDGAHTDAIKVLERAFNEETTGSDYESRDAACTLQYRSGVLYYRSGDKHKALTLLRNAAAFDPFPENWASRQQILFAEGVVALESGLLQDSLEAFSEGLALCKSARSAAGFHDHLNGTLRTLTLMGRSSEHDLLVDQVEHEEGILFSSSPLLTLPPKLPAYVPDVDLEDMPAIDLNRYLSGDRNGGGSHLWIQ